MKQILGFHKYFEKELSAFFYVLSLLGIIGNVTDIITLYLSHSTYELKLNILAILILIITSILYYRKTLSLKPGFILALYTIYVNIILSNFNLIHEPNHELFLLRESVFTGFLITAAFLFISQAHGLVIGLSYLIYYSYAVHDCNSRFLSTNLYVVFIVFISYIFTLHFFYKFINKSIQKTQEDAFIIKDQNEELTCMNEELGESQKQINAQHEELLALSESLYHQNEELVEKNCRLEDAIQQKTKFFSIIAHDLKSPISSLTSLTEQLLEDYDFMNEDKKKYWLNKSLSSTKLLYELLENLLTWSRSQTGLIVLNPELLNLNESIDKIAAIYRNYATSKSIQLLQQTTETSMIYADKMMIETILRNLLSNAIKYSYHHGVVSLYVQHNDHHAVISVTDNGVGIAHERMDTFFSDYDHPVTPGTSGEKGTGLGLRICKEFIEKHNGRIWVESEAGKGTTVNFSVPMV